MVTLAERITQTANRMWTITIEGTDGTTLGKKFTIMLDAVDKKWLTAGVNTKLFMRPGSGTFKEQKSAYNGIALYSRGDAVVILRGMFLSTKTGESGEGEATGSPEAASDSSPKFKWLVYTKTAI